MLRLALPRVSHFPKQKPAIQLAWKKNIGMLMQICKAIEDLTPSQLEQLAEIVAERLFERLRTNRRLLNRNELAEVLGVSVPTIDRLLREDDFPVIMIKSVRRFDPIEVIRHLAKKSAKPANLD